MTPSASSSSAGASGLSAGGAVVVSQVCDQSIRLLMVTLAAHRRSEAALAAGYPIRGRLKVLPSDSVNSRMRRESVLVRLVSVMESHVNSELVNRLAPLAPDPRTPLVESLYAEFEERGTASWHQMDLSFKAHVDKSVRIKSFSNWNQVNAVIEARNAVVHGLGRFTSRQSRHDVPAQVESHLKSLKYQLPADRSRVLVTPKALDQSIWLMRAYLEWLDETLAKFPPASAIVP